jgi:hypothetical protein
MRTMAKSLNCKTEIPFHIQKKNILVYSLYLAIGSVSLFIALNILNTAYQGFIWSYTTKYVLNSLAIALVLLIASALLFIGCYQILKGKKFSFTLGVIGCALLIVYPGYVFLIDFYVPYTFYYMLLLWIPALIVLMIAVFVWKKQK